MNINVKATLQFSKLLIIICLEFKYKNMCTL